MVTLDVVEMDEPGENKINNNNNNNNNNNYYYNSLKNGGMEGRQNLSFVFNNVETVHFKGVNIPHPLQVEIDR